MAGKTGSYFITIFNEAKRYLGNFYQQGKPLVDGDWNDQSESQQKAIQRPFQNMGKRFVGAAWQVYGQGSGGFTSLNNIQIFSNGAGIGNPETYGRGWIGGLNAQVTADRLYYNDNGGGFVPYTAQHLDEMFQLSSAWAFVAGTTWMLTDTSIQMVPGEHVGQILYPDLQDASFAGAPVYYEISANTVNTITIDTALPGSCGVAVPVTIVGREYYTVGMTTPVGARDDEVYLDMHIEEWNDTEDPQLNMPIGPGVECMRRMKIVQCVRVMQDTGTHGPIPTDYVDADGNQHFVVSLATIARLAGNANITDSMITDTRDPHFGSGQEVEDARGITESLSERIYRTKDPVTGAPIVPIDGVINPDGTLNPDAVSVSIAHSDLSNMPDTAVDPALAVADHDARYGDLTYSNGPEGAVIIQDNETHRDALSRLDDATAEALLARVMLWMNTG